MLVSLVEFNESPPHTITLQVMDTEEGEPGSGRDNELSGSGGWLASSWSSPVTCRPLRAARPSLWRLSDGGIPLPAGTLSRLLRKKFSEGFSGLWRFEDTVAGRVRRSYELA